MLYLKNLLRHTIPLLVAITLIYGAIYVIAQQTYRMGANDPQIQLAEDAALSLQGGQPVSSVVPSPKVDIGRSLSPYLVVYDDAGKPVAGSGRLHDQLPTLPAGVFDYTRSHGEDRLSWQPEVGVRSAVVIVHYAGTQPGFVMAGRSLREVENRLDQLLLQVGAGWVGTVFITFVVVVFVELLFRP